MGKSGNPTPKTPESSISRGRLWLFRLTASVVLPLVAFGILECALRVGGYGRRTDFFEKVRVGSRDYLVNNETFSLTFFPPQLARWPVPLMIDAQKPAGTYRIFVLGESAAMGDPEPAYGASRYLEALLHARFPSNRFEVVNVGMTAINSHVILPIARECARYDGDLWIVYMGNNEMVGPFGAATVFGSQSPPPAWWVRVTLGLQRTRTGQLMMDLVRKIRRDKSPPIWGGMEMFLGNKLSANDPRKEIVYHNFRSNLDGILRAGIDSGAKVLLNTVPVNLADCPPLASIVNSNLPAADRSASDRLFTEGAAAEQSNDFKTAVTRFSEAARLDPARAELHYRWAECLLRLASPAAAREQFQIACNDDALPFRADSRINEIIRTSAADRAREDRLTLLDTAAVLGTNNPSGLCGAETFYEHVHMNFDGNYRLARLWSEHIEPLLPADVRNRRAPEWATREQCDQLLGLPDWNRSFVIQSVLWRLDRPPLNGQMNNASRVAVLQNELAALHQQMNAASADSTRLAHEAAIRQSPNDHFLYENFAKSLESIGDLKSAAAQWKRVQELMPHNCIADYQEGRLLGLQHQWTEAEANLRNALAFRPSMSEGWFQLGNVHLGEEKYELVLQDYERARGLEPLNANYCVFTGKVLSKLNRRAEAIRWYQEALRIKPDSWEAHFAIGDEMAGDGKIAEAQKEYEEVLRLQPNNAMAHLNVGVALARQNRFDEALGHFEAALRADPGNQMARLYRDRILSAQQPK